jgi:hypothetical protein
MNLPCGTRSTNANVSSTYETTICRGSLETGDTNRHTSYGQAAARVVEFSSQIRDMTAVTYLWSDCEAHGGCLETALPEREGGSLLDGALSLTIVRGH